MTRMPWRITTSASVSAKEKSGTGSETQLKKAIELKPEYSDAHFNLAVLYATTQPPSLTRAKEHYVKATALGAAPMLPSNASSSKRVRRLQAILARIQGVACGPKRAA